MLSGVRDSRNGISALGRPPNSLTSVKRLPTAVNSISAPRTGVPLRLPVAEGAWLKEISRGCRKKEKGGPFERPAFYTGTVVSEFNAARAQIARQRGALMNSWANIATRLGNGNMVSERNRSHDRERPRQ